MDSRQTPLKEELVSVAREVGINETDFLDHYDNGSAEAAFREDLAITRSYSIHSLPCCLIQSGNEYRFVNGMIGYDACCSEINKLL